MFVNLPEPECIECGAHDSEIFTYGTVTGRRCIRCGHERILSDSSLTSDGSTSWYSDNTKPQF